MVAYAFTLFKLMTIILCQLDNFKINLYLYELIHNEGLHYRNILIMIIQYSVPIRGFLFLIEFSVLSLPSQLNVTIQILDRDTVNN